MCQIGKGFDVGNDGERIAYGFDEDGFRILLNQAADGIQIVYVINHVHVYAQCGEQPFVGIIRSPVDLSGGYHPPTFGGIQDGIRHGCRT
ncbi:hypothetical protein Barb7_02544 [Bacteroidales bacterium Barb7]|nr:hypothetical protein Barb7_02544 [Bacteroidales bacterium Barb7]